MIGFYAQIQRDLFISWQNRYDILIILSFFIVIVTFFPLAIGSSEGSWVFWEFPSFGHRLLASLAGFERLFSQDVRDGWIDQVSLSNLEFGWYAIAKATTHWLATGLPLLIAMSVLCLVLGIHTENPNCLHRTLLVVWRLL